MKLGQRELSAIVFLIASVFGIAVGKPPADALELIQQIVIPLGAAIVSFKFLADTINTRVVDGALTPGSFKELFALREFWLSIVVLGVSAVSATGLISLTDAQATELATTASNFIVVLLTTLQGTLIDRPSASLGAYTEVVTPVSSLVEVQTHIVHEER